MRVVGNWIVCSGRGDHHKGITAWTGIINSVTYIQGCEEIVHCNDWYIADGVGVSLLVLSFHYEELSKSNVMEIIQT